MSAEVEQVSAYAALAAAVSDRDPELARSRAEELLSHATNSLIAAIDALEEA
jgi:DNA-binding FadR family transcriptional regulator